MCGRPNYEEEALEFDLQLLRLFRSYELDVKAELSTEEMKFIAHEQLMKSFLLAIRNRLPEVLEKQKKQRYDHLYFPPMP